MKVLKWLDVHLEEAICITAMASLSCVMMLQVIMRYCFEALTWPEEFCRYAYIYSAFVGVAYCIRNNRLLKVTMLVDLLPEKMIKAIQVFSGVFTLVFCCIMLRASTLVTINCYEKGQVSSATGWVMWIIYLAGPLGFGLSIIRQIQQLILMFIPKKEEKQA